MRMLVSLFEKSRQVVFVCYKILYIINRTYGEMSAKKELHDKVDILHYVAIVH
jgi:hypothetical protein